MPSRLSRGGGNGGHRLTGPQRRDANRRVVPDLCCKRALTGSWPHQRPTNSRAARARPHGARADRGAARADRAARRAGRARAHQVARALQEGKTFTAIARPLGISRQAAHRRYRDLATPRRQPTLSPEARAALLRAREEAARHGSRSIDGQHLLLALAGSGALRSTSTRRAAASRPPAINAPAPAGLHPSLHARLVAQRGPLGARAARCAPRSRTRARGELLDGSRGCSVQQLVDGRPVADRRGAAPGRACRAPSSACEFCMPSGHHA